MLAVIVSSRTRRVLLSLQRTIFLWLHFIAKLKNFYDPTPKAALTLKPVFASCPVSVAVSPVSGKVFCTNLGKAECCITVLNADLNFFPTQLVARGCQTR